MKAKDYLLQVMKIDKMIENKMYEKEHWFTMATKTTQASEGERVQTSGSSQRMADSVEKYVQIEKEIDEAIDCYINKKMEVISTIEQLNYQEYDILHKVYIQGLKLYDIAEMYDRTYSWVTQIHGNALKNLQEILDKRTVENCEEAQNLIKNHIFLQKNTQIKL